MKSGYEARHRGATERLTSHRAIPASRPRLRRLLRPSVVAGVAGVATISAATSSVVFAQSAPAAPVSAAVVGEVAASPVSVVTLLRDRTVAIEVSRAAQRASTTRVSFRTVAAARVAEVAKARLAAAAKAEKALLTGKPKDVGRAIATSKGWGGEQFACLDKLWTKESNWTVTAANPSSGAYGIPQSLPGSKMASHGKSWRTDAATQIKWGLDYIKDRYGSPCSAWSHSQAVNWY